MHGVGTYVYHDGRADVCEYKSGSDVEKECASHQTERRRGG